ncbi:MAG TPA: riboflavin synthase [Nevskiaceae bacterium]|nr:riboflavin synthase [Nevskiaceae bacterium]
MFTGIVEVIGRIAAIAEVMAGRRVTVEAKKYFRGAKPGDSISVNGVCLTAVRISADRFTADVSAETLRATTAGRWKVGTAVNLERALTAAKPLGGHFVSGHVDGVAKAVSIGRQGSSRRMRFEAPRALSRYIARKGSVCVDGVSLTVNEVARNSFDLMIIPHTLAHTTLGTLEVGGAVNLEVDLVARYLERLLAARE